MGISVSSQEPSPIPRKNSQNWQSCSTKTDKNGNTHQYCSQKEPLLIKVAESQGTYPDANKQGQNVYQKSSGKNIIDIISIALTAIATVAIAIFTLFLVCYNKKMWKTTIQSVNATKEAAEAAKSSVDNISKIERAYIFTTVEQHPNTCEPIHGVDGFKGIYAFNATVKLWNLGRTPAVITKIHAVISLGEAIIPEIKESEIPPGIVVGSDTWKNLPTVSYHINEAEKQNIHSRERIAYCCGRIEYQDVFRKRWVRGFCWEYSQHDSRPTEPWIISERYKDYNYEDEIK